MFEWIYIYGLREVDTSEYRYIGQTDDLSRRIIEHKTKKYRDYEKETWIEEVLARDSNIEIIMLDKCTKRDATTRERSLIRYYSGLGHRLLNKRLI